MRGTRAAASTLASRGSALISEQSPRLVASVSWRAPRAWDRYAGQNEHKILATGRIAVQDTGRLGLRTMPKKSADAPASLGPSPSRPPRARAADTVRGGSTGTIEPIYNEIAEAAYLRYLSRGGTHGQDVDDWMEAERELRARRISR